MKLQSYRIMVFVLIGVSFLSVPSIFAETIVLKSGKTVEGKLIEKTDKYIKINFEGVPLIYFLDEVNQIDGVAVTPLSKEEAVVKTVKPMVDSSLAFASQSTSAPAEKDISLVAPIKEVPQIKDGDEISLDNLEEAIFIPISINQIKLKRGAYVDTLIKEKAIEAKKYIIEHVFSLGKSQEPTPYEAFSAAIQILPAEDARVLRYWNLTGGKDFSNLKFNSMDEANKMMADVEYTNQVRVSIQILPANAEVKEASKKIKQGDIIRLSGIQFKHVKEMKNNVKQPQCPGWDATRIYYVSQLTAEQ